VDLKYQSDFVGGNGHLHFAAAGCLAEEEIGQLFPQVAGDDAA
jgi:hypothetical protein